MLIFFVYFPLSPIILDMEGGAWGNSFALRCLKDLEGSLRYPLGREGVYGPGGHAFLAHTKQKVSNIHTHSQQ